MTESTRVLIVANRTAPTPALLEAVRARARVGSATFHLVVPATPRGLHRLVDPEVAGLEEARENLRRALPGLSQAAGAPVTGAIGDANPVSAVEDAMNLEGYDEVMISTLGRKISRWLRLDVVSKLRSLGVPVTHVRPDAVDACMLEPVSAGATR
ncbi:MAG: hypothetical protein ACR2NB_04170 [Solirubrobacteraceae bacterium]